MNIELWEELDFLNADGELKDVRERPKEIKGDLDKLSGFMEKFYAHCLADLRPKFQGENNCFYEAFSYAYWETYLKRKKNKAQYWSLRSLILPIIGVGGAGSVAVTGFITILNTLLANIQPFSEREYLSWLLAHVKIYLPPCLLFFTALVVVWFCVVCYQSELRRRDYRGTWVRHSMAYHRLNLSIVRCSSGMITEADFMKETMEILGNNLKQFEYNLRTWKEMVSESKETDASR